MTSTRIGFFQKWHTTYNRLDSNQDCITKDNAKGASVEVQSSMKHGMLTDEFIGNVASSLIMQSMQSLSRQNSNLIYCGIQFVEKSILVYTVHDKYI